MKRELELCREIMLQTEENLDPLGMAIHIEISGYSEVEIGYNTYLLGDAGLLEVADGFRSMNAPWRYMPLNLTWEGHEFLDASRNESVWKKALETIGEKGLPVTFELLKPVLPEVLQAFFHSE